MPGSKYDVFKLQVTRYIDGEGRPTCAADFSDGRVCMFYRTKKLGTIETCIIAVASETLKDWVSTQRSEGDV